MAIGNQYIPQICVNNRYTTLIAFHPVLTLTCNRRELSGGFENFGQSCSVVHAEWSQMLTCVFISWECIYHGFGYFWYHPSIFRCWKCILAVRDIWSSLALGTETAWGGESSGWNIPGVFAYDYLRTGLDFVLLLGDNRYVVITTSENPFHFQEGTEIHYIF